MQVRLGKLIGLVLETSVSTGMMKTKSLPSMTDNPSTVGAYDSAANDVPTVSVTLTRSLLEAVVELGVPREQLLAEVGLTEHLLDEPDLRVPAPRHEAIYTFASRWLGNEDRVWQQVATHRRPEAYHVLGYILRNAVTVREGIEDVLKYIRVISEVYSYQLDLKGDTSILGEAPHPTGYRSTPLGLVGTLASWTASLRGLLGADFAPLEVRFTHPEPADLSAYTAFFRCPVSFAQPRWGIVFAAELLDRPPPNRDPGLLGLLRHRAEQLLTLIPVGDSYVNQVKQLLNESMHSGDAGIARVAARLGMSVRTLQRRLRKEGASFSDVLDSTRYATAIRHVSAGNLSFGEIAYLLGYSDPVAFHHAFRRWTGLTPGKYRSHHTAGRVSASGSQRPATTTPGKSRNFDGASV